jgi:Multiubiquitin
MTTEESHERKIVIFIDGTEYRTRAHKLTGEEIRHLPTPPIGPERDLWLEIPGGHDKLIGNDEEVELHDGMRFFTAPATINPGLNARPI